MYGKLWGCVQPKTKLGQPKKNSRVSRLITKEVLVLERKSLYMWVASVVLHPNIKLDLPKAAILCPGMTTVRRHSEISLGACTLGILYTKLSGSKKITHQRPHLPGN